MRGNQTGMLHVYMNSLLDIREGTFSSIDRICRRRGNRKRVLPAGSGGAGRGGAIVRLGLD